MTAATANTDNSNDFTLPLNNNSTRVAINAATISRNSSNKNLQHNNGIEMSNQQQTNNSRTQEIEKLKMQIFEEEQLKYLNISKNT